MHYKGWMFCGKQQLLGLGCGAEGEGFLFFWKQVFLKMFRAFVECKEARLNTKQVRQTEECPKEHLDLIKTTTTLKST